MNIHKAMIIPDGLFQTNKKLFVVIHPRNVCKVEFAGHLWLPFLDKPQSHVVVFTIITFQIDNILVTKWKHGIGTNDIIIFNGELNPLSTSIIELVNIDQSSYE